MLLAVILRTVEVVRHAENLYSESFLPQKKNNCENSLMQLKKSLMLNKVIVLN
jgi:hypothetical protein